MPTGVIIVDHGSRRPESNEMLLQVVAQFEGRGEFSIVEPAHMEIAEPSIAAAFDRCVDRGARRIIVFPYFLLPGRHWKEDIPALAAAAAKRHPGVQYLVTAPLALHPLMSEIISQRISYCSQSAWPLGSPAATQSCDVCDQADRCQWQTADDELR